MDHAQTQRQLELIQALDRIRDSYGDDEDPAAMFTAITTLLAEQFAAEACGILLLGSTDDALECVASSSMDAWQVIELGHRALALDGWSPLNTTSPINTLAAPIILNGERLGAIILIRPQRAFDETDWALLQVAESQVDSAVIQARTTWKYRQRNRELEAIHEIDHLRDYTPYEADLISGFTSILLKYFKAELCMIILNHSDSGDLILRGLVDKNTMPAQTLDAIREAVEDLSTTGTLPAPAGFNQLHLLAAPLFVSGTRIGGIVVGRTTPFRSSEHHLLTVMTTQMDSAIAYSRLHQQLNQRSKELEVIYRIDRIRDQETDFDTLLQKVLRELCEVVSGETGYIMLYTDREETPLEMKSSTVDGALTSPEYSAAIQHFSRQALDTGQLIYDNAVNVAGVRSIVAVPLILNQRIIGVFGAVNSRHARGFSSEDRRLLSAITSQVDTAIFERLEQRRMRSLLSRSVDPKVLDYMLRQTNAANMLAGGRIVISVLFADLRGSTQWAEHIEPEELVAVLNLFLGKMTDVIFNYGGTLDKFVGDQVIGLFGSPLFLPDHAERATAAALEMQAAHRELAVELAARGHELPLMGVGISSGEVIAGEIGPSIRTDFTAVGRAMNLGARLCSAAGPGQIFISQATYDLVQLRSEVRVLEPLQLKGISQPAPVYELLALKEA
jgi:adenylate cyclase